MSVSDHDSSNNHESWSLAGEEDEDEDEHAAAYKRRRRGHIATQACETCRTRKSRCDQAQPKCTLCVRIDVECVYTDKRPTKKDQTEALILATMKRIGGKVDQILDRDRDRDHHRSSAATKPAAHGGGSSSSSTIQGFGRMGITATSLHAENISMSSPSPPGYGHLRGALSILPWPSIQSLFVGAGAQTVNDIEEILHEGSGWIFLQELQKNKLAPMTCDSLSPSSSLHLVTGSGEQVRTVFSDLSEARMEEYADAYFASFNMTYPVLDRGDFKRNVFPTVRSYGFADGCSKSLIALLVFALGKGSIEGSQGKPIAPGSGIRGGGADRPPAIEIFNEARRRLGFVVSTCSLENAQAMLLMAIFYESCSKHIDFWRTALTAADGIKALLRIKTRWDSHQVDMLRRVYWICLVIESWYYFDLNLPGSGIDAHEESVDLPVFDYQGAASQSAAETTYQYSFLAMVSIRRLIHHIFKELHDSTEIESAGGDEMQGGRIIGQLSHQLDTWRLLLPEDLRWDDDLRMVVSLNPSPNFDIIVAQLRCRYYYARFMIFQPYIWKALHFPTLQLVPDVIDRFVMGVDSMLQWPLAYSPLKDKKRLIPNSYAWTQSFLMFLLILRAIREDPRLVQVCTDRIGLARMDESVEVMLEWMDDMQQVDGVAAWSRSTLRPLYQLAE